MRRAAVVLVCLSSLGFCVRADAQPADAPQTESIQYLKTPSGVRLGLWGPRAEAPSPTLFILAGTAEQSLGDPYFRQCGNALAEEGFLCVSLDLPCHGENREQGEPEELKGWSHRVARDRDFVTSFVARIEEAIDFLVSEGKSDPARVAVCGTSRGGFLALHCLAREPRIACAAAFAPVTDLADLTEFKGLEKNELVKSLALETHAGALAGRPVWLVIGDQDRRVNTDRAIALARRVSAISVEKGVPSGIELHVMPEPRGHTTPAGSSEQAAVWISHHLGADINQGVANAE